MFCLVLHGPRAQTTAGARMRRPADAVPWLLAVAWPVASRSVATRTPRRQHRPPEPSRPLHNTTLRAPAPVLAEPDPTRRVSMLGLATLLVAAAALSLVTQPSTAAGNETVSLTAAAARVGGVEEACPSLRSKRFISDGLCSSPYPVHEVVCADRAPSHGRRRKQQQQQSPPAPAQRERQRCVEGATRRRRVELLCQDGSRRFYHVRLVKSCRLRGQRRHRRPPEAPGV